MHPKYLNSKLTGIICLFLYISLLHSNEVEIVTTVASGRFKETITIFKLYWSIENESN